MYDASEMGPVKCGAVAVDGGKDYLGHSGKREEGAGIFNGYLFDSTGQIQGIHR